MTYIIQNSELVIAFNGSVHIYPNDDAGFAAMVNDFWRSK